MRNKSLSLTVALIILLGGVFAVVYFYSQSKQSERQVPLIQQSEKDIEVVAQNLNIPWEVAFLPFDSAQGEILITERPGTLLLIKNKQKIPISGVEHVGEGGLLGLAVHPDFQNSRYIYLYYTYNVSEASISSSSYSSAENNTLNRVSRFKFENNRLTEEEIIVDAIPGAVNHNGGRIKFGPTFAEASAGKPDNFLYITTGDAQNPSLAQDKSSLAGKILRVTDIGKPAPGNPFNNLVYSYGHRNPQGLAWDNQGRLWATEHGPQAFDEVNLIGPPAGGGKNYGWPIIQGDQKQEGMVSPVIQSGEDVTWAPAGAVFLDGSIFFGGLRGESLFEYKIADKSLKRHFQGQFGRIRAVVLGPDNYLYITTSNTDGRGNPKENDDKLIKINPKIFR
ncbi:MAG: PQQ-dependent sugar dehydrogenase [Candidatus Levybacteria bacterium]|nr:PQQ-dependent sugar dehydrogenase [Candidatus Levybacteria bacterium]